MSSTGAVNLAAYSFFNAFNYNPPIIGFSSTTSKDAIANTQQTGSFVWNLTCAPLPAGAHEFTFAGLEAAPCRLVHAPRVAASPVSFECVLTQIVPLETRDGNTAGAWLTLGEVVGVHIDTELLKDGVYQTALAEPVLRGSGHAISGGELPPGL